MQMLSAYPKDHPLYNLYYTKPTPYSHCHYHSLIGSIAESDETIRQPLLFSQDTCAQAVGKKYENAHQSAAAGSMTEENIVERRTSYGRGGAGNLRM